MAGRAASTPPKRRVASPPAASNNDAPASLAHYAAKRNFKRTPEPQAEAVVATAPGTGFVIQKHWASRLHYDFRLELDGVLLSWALPKGPSFDPQDKRIAVRVEDHPLAYGSFEGTIPPKQYGAGTVIVWDRGAWTPIGDPREGLAVGKLLFDLHGEKLAGRWELVRIAKPQDKQDLWILFKKRDAWARPVAEYNVVAALPDSVVAKPLGKVEAREPRGATSNESGGARGRGDGSGGPDARRDALTLADLPQAVAAALPVTLAPQLATLAAAVPTSGRWLCEIKFDGYRLLARIEGGRARLHTRNGHDWSAKMPALCAALESLAVESAWLDGEIVVLNEAGMPDFNALQNAMDGASARIDYFVFDLPWLDGHDLREVPLQDRRALLRPLIEGHEGEHLRYSADFPGDPASVLASARAMGLEGIVLKRADAPYVSRRAATWLKLKCRQRQEFVIGGYIDRAGSAGDVGSLLLGYYDAAGRLRHAGNVGSGWGGAAGGALLKRLLPLATDASPFEVDTIEPGRWSKRAAGGERWVRPVLVAEVDFADWTPDGHVRHAVYAGLRADKPAREVRRESVGASAGGSGDKAAGKATSGLSAKKTSAAPARTARTLTVTHPERVVDASTGLKKRDLVRYYESVAERILPHLKGRPVSLVRGPNSIGGTLFFQKHMDPLHIPGLREFDAGVWPGHAALLDIGSVDALLGAAQMNVIEFHTWNSTAKARLPDRMVLDLDPGEGVAWARIQEAAMLTRTLLDELGLRSWLKTSGGKGLHVVVPIAPKLDADAVKDFSRVLVQHLAKTIPSRFVAKSGPANRVGRVFVDYLRNGLAATTAAAFSARSRPGLGVSMPVAWEQLAELKSGAQWTIANARDHLSFESVDPWADYWRCRQTLAAAMKRLGHRMPTVVP